VELTGSQGCLFDDENHLMNKGVDILDEAENRNSSRCRSRFFTNCFYWWSSFCNINLFVSLSWLV
jgi:hypothetical protein